VNLQFGRIFVNFQQATWCYIPEGRILHNHRCENLYIYARFSDQVGNYKPPKKSLYHGDHLYSFCNIIQETDQSNTHFMHVSHHFCPSFKSPCASRFSFCGLQVKSFRQRQTQYLCPREVKGFGINNKPVEFNNKNVNEYSNKANIFPNIYHWYCYSFTVHKSLFAQS
jgi:hypothetical protein